MTDYQPGTFAEIGWAMTSGRERAIFDGDRWATESGITVHPSNVTDVRPLVTLDLAKLGPRSVDYPHTFRQAATHADSIGWTGSACILRNLADQIEAQTKPPRIPEPGLWGVVEATVAGIPRRRWVHHEEGRWVSDEGTCADWNSLQDPELIREGVQS